jgi:hypothetical protein
MYHYMSTSEPKIEMVKFCLGLPPRKNMLIFPKTSRGFHTKTECKFKLACDNKHSIGITTDRELYSNK